MATLPQVTLQITKVVNFPIEHDENRLILVEDGLMSTCNINDGKATHTQRDAVTYPDALIVRSTMANDGAHASNQLLYVVLAAIRVAVNESSNAAHAGEYPF